MDNTVQTNELTTLKSTITAYCRKRLKLNLKLTIRKVAFATNYNKVNLNH